VELDYDDEYEEKRAEAKKPIRRNRNRYRDEEDTQDEDYDERPSKRPRGKPTAGPVGRKVSPRKPGRVEERRSFNEDRPLGRRRVEKDRTTPSSALDDLDEYEKPYGGADQEEAAEEQTPQKVKTTPKPLTEFITPKAAAASVYARPRAPPRIARPVPINEKKKFSYPVQKITATTQPPSNSAQEEEDYPEEQVEEEYEQPPARNTPRRRTPAPRNRSPKKQGVIGKIFELRALKLSRKIVPCINRKAEEELPRQSAMPIKYTPRVRKDQGDLAQTMRNKNTIFGRNKLHLTLAIDCQITMLQ